MMRWGGEGIYAQDLAAINTLHGHIGETGTLTVSYVCLFPNLAVTLKPSEAAAHSGFKVLC